jgi:hypothetical protein
VWRFYGFDGGEAGIRTEDKAMFILSFDCRNRSGSGASR